MFNSLDYSPLSHSLWQELNAPECLQAYLAFKHEYSEQELKTKYQILLAAIVMINDSCYEDMSMNELVNSGIASRRTVYKYFKNKEYLSGEISLVWAIKMFLQLSKKPPAGNNSQEKLYNLFRHQIGEALAYPKLLACAIKGLANPSSNTPVGTIEFEDSTLALYGQLVDLDTESEDNRIRLRLLMEIYVYNLIALGQNSIERQALEEHMFKAIDLLIPSA